MKEALFYEKKDNLVKCTLCPHKCELKEGQIGFCGVRKNINNKLYTLVYNKAASLAIDPIEKKPLFHFYPSQKILSIATMGCNLACKYCQNYSLSFFDGKGKTDNIDGTAIEPKEVVDYAIKHNTIGIAYTYSEPTIFYEYLKDISIEMKKKNLKNVWVTNGYIEKEPQLQMKDYIDAVNNDLKFMSDEKYKKFTSGRLKPVLLALKRWKKMGIWLEVTTLVIPGLNDNQKEISDIIDFIKNELGAETPWHISRFYPQYKMKDFAPTPTQTLINIRETALEKGLKYVYIGNIWESEGENTYCPNCGKIIIKRSGYNIDSYNIKDSKCINCGEKIDGVGL